MPFGRFRLADFARFCCANSSAWANRRIVYISNVGGEHRVAAVATRDYGDHRMATINEIIDNFALLDEWDDRYRYLIELGRALTPLPDAARTDSNKVQGCASQVWLATDVRPNGPAGPVLDFVGDSDAHIVRGLIAILFALYSGLHARDILATDAIKVFERLGMREHLTPQRSNGFRSMVERIRADARSTLATA